jgi:hypothetical protein
VAPAKRLDEPKRRRNRAKSSAANAKARLCAAGGMDGCEESSMRFVFSIKTKNGSVVTDINIDARDQKEAEERIKKENPTCTITKVEQK